MSEKDSTREEFFPISIARTGSKVLIYKMGSYVVKLLNFNDEETGLHRKWNDYTSIVVTCSCIISPPSAP